MADETHPSLANEARLRALLEAAVDFAIIEMDADGRITFWNSGAEALLGWTAEEAMGLDAAMVYTPEDRQDHIPERERAEALAHGRSDNERWHIRKDGSRFFGHERVIAYQHGDRRHFLKVLRNRSEEHATEEARAASEEQMRLILDSATDYAIFTVDRDNLVTTWNLGAERLLGYSEHEIMGRSGSIIFTPEDRRDGAPRREIEKAQRDGRAEDERWHVRKDGSRFWASGLMLPLKGTGAPGFLKIMRDQTQRHRAEERNKLLIGELNHRVKNTLAIVQVIVNESLRGRVHEQEIRDALNSRLTALAWSHDILARESWQKANLREVIERALAPFLANDNMDERLVTEGTDIAISPKCAVSLGMGLHELATNAAKYGALSTPEGRVEVRWTYDPSEDGAGLHLCWKERNGPPVSPPTRKGFGSRLIERALSYETNGAVTLDYAPDGVSFEITIPQAALQDGTG